MHTVKNTPVVLVNVSRRCNDISFPMGLSVVANTLVMHSIEPQVIDLMLVPAEQHEQELLKNIPKELAIYGFSLMLGNHHLDETEKIVKIILQKSPGSIIVYGGSLPSSLPEMVLEQSSCDYVVHGEAEETFPAMINALRHGHQNLDQIGGVLFMRDGKLVGQKNRRMRKLDNLSNLNYGLFDVQFYVDYLLETKRGWEIMATRGCRAHCTFCHKFMGDGMSLKDVDHVLDEMQYIMDCYGIHHFYFVDENLLQIKKYFLRFIAAKNRRNMKFTFAAQTRVDEIDDDRCRIGAENGLKMVSTGIESVSQSTLDRINKKIFVSDVEKAIQLARQYGIEVFISLIIGFPEDTEADYKEMLRFIKRNQLEGHVKLHYLTPLPSTVLYQEVLDKGLIKDEIKYIKNLNNLYWERVINLTTMADETLDHYYQAISSIGKRAIVPPKSQKYQSQMNRLFMYQTVSPDKDSS